jgi:hypothetical protein
MLLACRQALLSCALARDMLIFGNTQETVCRLSPPRALPVVSPNSPSAQIGILLKAAPRKAVYYILEGTPTLRTTLLRLPRPPHHP